MKRMRIGLITLLTLAWITAWAAAPVPLVTGDSFSWPAVTASTVNVHRGDGSYIESLPGDATSWTAPEPGEYFLVATNEGHWSSWPRSVTVTVIDPSVVSAVTGLSARVYSHTAAEIFWDRKAGAGNRYRVSVNGEAVALTDGTSWFSDNFQANSISVMWWWRGNL